MVNVVFIKRDVLFCLQSCFLTTSWKKGKTNLKKETRQIFAFIFVLLIFENKTACITTRCAGLVYRYSCHIFCLFANICLVLFEGAILQNVYNLWKSSRWVFTALMGQWTLVSVVGTGFMNYHQGSCYKVSEFSVG